MAVLSERMEAATSEIEASYERFDKARGKVRGEMKNDAAAIAAGADKIAKEFAKAISKVDELCKAMRSAEMIEAIANAERLAAALTLISQVKANKLALAILDSSSHP